MLKRSSTSATARSGEFPGAASQNSHLGHSPLDAPSRLSSGISPIHPKKRPELTVNAIKLISITEFTSFPREGPARRVTGCKLGELGAPRATAHRNKRLDLGVLSLQLGKRREAASLAVNLLFQVAKLVEELRVSVLGLHGGISWLLALKVPSSFTLYAISFN